jgi:hypothetical protein
MYIPPEVEQKLKTLESELAKAKKANLTLTENLKSAQAGKKLWVVLCLVLLISGGVGGYFAWNQLSSVEVHTHDDEQIATVADTTLLVPNWNVGLWYSVQVGAYEKRDLQLYDGGLMQFRMFKDDILFKYSLGVFSSYDEAHRFRKEMLQLGLKDAFVQAYSDGKPIEIGEALGKGGADSENN